VAKVAKVAKVANVLDFRWVASGQTLFCGGHGVANGDFILSSEIFDKLVEGSQDLRGFSHNLPPLSASKHRAGRTGCASGRSSRHARPPVHTGSQFAFCLYDG
jgi:hypothetical protein